MIVNAREIESGSVVRGDVCIVGAGAAGITLAMELGRAGVQVILLESGGVKADDVEQSLTAGPVIGEPFLDLAEASRRMLGGNTTRWNSWCTPLNEHDLEHRPWVPFSGWPIGYDELTTRYERACIICGLGSTRFDTEYWQDAITDERFRAIRFPGDDVMTRVWHFANPPRNFGAFYRVNLDRATNIRTLLHATVTSLDTDESATRVRTARVRVLGGSEFTVAASAFVLAAGGIENPRIMLASGGSHSAGLGNRNDQVGRYFMDHPHFVAARFRVRSPKAAVHLYTHVAQNLFGIRGGLCTTPEVQRRERLLNYSVTLMPQPSALRRMARRLRGRGQSERLSTDVLQAIADLPRLPAMLARKLLRRDLPTPTRFRLYVRCEQAPNPNSRVMLADEPDALGVPRAAVDWHVSEQDKRSIVLSGRIVRQALEATGLGQVEPTLDDVGANWPRPLATGWHPTGATRMSDDPKLGVVDANCKVHDITNLYVAGSSVFPTSGYANPTLTIVALSLRLAEHLKAQLNESIEIKIKNVQSSAPGGRTGHAAAPADRHDA